MVRTRKPRDGAGCRVSPCLVSPASFALPLQHHSGRNSEAKLDSVLFFKASMLSFGTIAVDSVPQWLWNSSTCLQLTGSICIQATTPPSLALFSQLVGRSLLALEGGHVTCSGQ